MVAYPVQNLMGEAEKLETREGIAVQIQRQSFGEVLFLNGDQSFVLFKSSTD